MQTNQLSDSPSAACATCPGVKPLTTNGNVYQLIPGTTASTTTGTPSGLPDQDGWLIDSTGASGTDTTEIPAGNWTFQASITQSATTSGTYAVRFGLWKATVASNTVTSTAVLLDPTKTTGQTTNYVQQTAAQTNSVTVALPQINLASNEHLTEAYP